MSLRRPTLARGLLLACLALLLAWPGLATARSGVLIDGLPGLAVQVAIAADPGTDRGQPGWPAPEQYQAWLEGGRGPLQATGVWLRIDLTVPDALRGQVLWLQLIPATAWRAQLHLPDGTVQKAGMGLPRAQHSHPAVLPRFRVVLDQPRLRLHLNVANTLAPLTHLSFLSEEALRTATQAAALRQGLFMGSALLMLLLALMNWTATGDSVHRSFAVYVGCASALLLCTSGYVAAFVVTGSPALVARANLLAGVLLVWATVRLSIDLLALDRHRPRLAAGLRWTMRGTLLLGVLGMSVQLITPLGRLLWALHLLIGLLLLVTSAQLAWRQRSGPAAAVFAGYLLFNLFEKMPLLTMLGLLPVQAWSGEMTRLGLVFQMLLTHLHLVLRLRAQRDAEQRALAAGLEAQSERAQRAELSKFLGMFGHEVRTPLAIIDAATQSLELLPGGDQPAHGQRHQRIRAAVQRLDRLAREALSRERLASGSWQLRPRPVALADLLEDTLVLQGLLLPADTLADGLAVPMDIGDQPGGELLVCLPPDRPDPSALPGLLADPDLLQVALGNLLDNARKYADRRSQVQLQLHLTDAQALRLCVVSQGSALSAEERTLVFEKYWRRDEQGSVGGAGLGLHLVRSIAQLHGGRAWADSLPDRRTAFCIELPLRAPAAVPG